MISGLTKTLTKINEMRPTIPELERDYFESLHIVLDTLEKCLSAKAQVRTSGPFSSISLEFSFSVPKRCLQVIV